jgi:4-hydroxybenzoyl-CoA thioesterase
MPFRNQIRVVFSDIDNAGIVYYPRFLHYFHLALEEFFEHELGVEYADVLHERNLSLPTVHVEADFRRKLRFGDRIEMEVLVYKIGRSSVTWGYRGYRTGEVEELVVEGSNVVVCMRSDTSEKMAVPDWLREGLTAYKARYEGEKARPRS